MIKYFLIDLFKPEHSVSIFDIFFLKKYLHSDYNLLQRISNKEFIRLKLIIQTNINAWKT